MSKIYSFDLFDTLVTRKVNHPKDVFTLVEATGIIKFRFFLNLLVSFKTLRVFSEKLSRFLKRKQKEDISIFDIYRVLGFFIHNPSNVLIKEINIELSVIIPIKKNINIFNDFLKENKILCITSDMYLPKITIKNILKKYSINTNLIYLSSEVGLTKASGNLFRFISNQHKINLFHIIHYGDNVRSDIEVPRNLGLTAIHVGTPMHRESFGFLDCFKSPIQDDHYYKIGYEFCGKISYVFAKYIHENLSIDKNYNLVFGARDSYLFKFAFDLFFNQSNEYKTYYTRISRSLVYLPEVYFSKTYDRLFFETMSCDDFFSRIDLVCPEELEGKSVWLNKQNIENYLTKDDLFNTNLKRKALLVKEYLIKNGFDQDVYFIDLGWKGSIQDSLKFILNSDSNIEGYYVGIVNKHTKKNGFIFKNKKPFRPYFYIMQSIALFEFLFTEPQKSLKSIKKESEKYCFIFTDDESNDQINIRKQIKAGAEQFLLDYFELNKNHDFSERFVKKSTNPLIFYNTMCVRDDFVATLFKLSHSAGFNASLQSSVIGFTNFSIVGYLTAPWKAYFMAELKKVSTFKYYLYLILFHNVVFFVFYEYFKTMYRKVRALIYG